MLKEILKSIQSYFGSFSLISKLGLWKYFFIPILISLITGVLVSVLAYTLSDDIGDFIANIWIWEFGKSTFAFMSSIIGGLTVIAIGLILYRHIVMALSAPFMSPVSDKIEKHFNPNRDSIHRKTSFCSQLFRGIKINFRNLALELLITLPLLLLKFIPIINVFSSVLLIVIQAYYTGFGNMDYTLERYFNYSKSIQFVKLHRGTAIGNGLVFIICLLLPIIGVIIVLPLSVTASSIRTLELLDHNQNIVLNER